FLPARGGPFFSLSVYNAARFLSSANGCNEITVSPYTTKKTKCPQKRHFVVFVGFVAFVIPLGGREIVISLKSLISWVSGGTVKPLKSLKPLVSCFSGGTVKPLKSLKPLVSFAVIPSFYRLSLRWARGPGRVFRLPLPRPSGLPTLPQRPGRSPGPKSGRSLRASG